MSTFTHRNDAGGEMGSYEGSHLQYADGVVKVMDNHGDDASAIISLLPGHVVYREAEKEAS